MKQLKTVLFSALLFSLPTLIFAQISDVTAGCVPLEVNFTAPSGAASFAWNFGDGNSSVLQNPTHVYTNPGTYQVQFRQTPNGPVQATVEIKIFAKPDLNIFVDKNQGCVPLIVGFRDTSTVDPGITVNNYRWTFGDGLSGNGENIVHTYNIPGNFSVSLAIETNYPSCNVTEIFNNSIQVNQPPSVNFTTTPASPLACDPPLNVAFTNRTVSSNPVTYLWDFGNGNTFAGQNPPSQVYNQNGQFTTTLIATDDIGCADTFSIIVGVGKPVANFSAPDTACAGVPIQFTNLSPNGIFLWQFDATADPPLSSLRNPTSIFFFEGNYDIFLRVTDPGGRCSSDTIISIYIDAVDVSFATDPKNICSEPVDITYTPNSSEGVRFNWRFSDESTSSSPMPTHTFVNPDTTTYGINGVILDSTYLEIFNARGCKGFAVQADTIYLPNALFAPDTTMGCAPLTVEFSDLSTSSLGNIVRWTYIYGDGSSETFNNNDPVQHTFTQAGEYPVRLVIENEAGCTDTSYAIIIEVGEPLSPDFAVDKTTVCPGDTVFFSDLTNDPRVDAWHYSTDNDRLWHCADEPNPFWVFESETGPMDVTLQVLYNGCKSEIFKDDLILVNGPIAKIDYKIECGAPFEVSFTDTSYEATTLTWYFGDGDSTFVVNPTHTYAAAGNYEVVLVAANNASGCAESRDTVSVFIRDIEAKFELAATYCQGTTFKLDASQSQDVNATCWKGYTWFFTDNRPITTQDAAIDYAFQGRDTQVVTLIVEDINGCRDTILDTTTVFKATAAFEADDLRICIPGEVNFTDLSFGDTTLTEWEWKFGDGGTSDDRNPSYTFDAPPPGGQTFFSVELLVRDVLECTDSLEIRIEVYTPFSQITTDPIVPNICVGEEVIFGASDFTDEGSRLLYTWDFGNGQNSNQQNDTIQYNQSGAFTVDLLYEEEATGCSGTTSKIVNVQDYPIANFRTNVDNVPIICYPEQIDFIDNSNPNTGLSFAWDFGIPGGPPGPNAPVVSASYGKGTFLATLVVSTSFGCMDTVSRSFTLVGPEGDFDLSDDLICRGDAVTFTIRDTVDISSFLWDFRDGTTITNNNPVSHVFNTRGRQEVLLELRGENDACKFFVTKELFVADVTANFDTDAATYCIGQPVRFSSSSTNATSFQWNFGDNSNPSVQENPTHSYATPGTYNVRLIVNDDDSGCSDTIVKPVSVVPQITVSITGDDQICAGDSTILRLTNPDPTWDISWIPAALVFPSDGPVVQVKPLTTTNFTVNIFDTNGCQGTATFTVTVNQDPGINGDSLSVLVSEGATEITLPALPNSVSGFNISWNATTGFDISNILQPIVAGPITQTTSYIATVSDPNGCGLDAFKRTIKIFKVPNVFTPNGDQTNDRFNIVLGEDEEVNASDIEDFRIYNRWGQLVYENDSPTLGWDGNHNGKAAPSDVYVYVIKVRLVDGSVEVVKGDVTLLR